MTNNADIETYACPECAGPMEANAEGFLYHLESTDCAPDPWPTTEDAAPWTPDAVDAFGTTYRVSRGDDGSDFVQHNDGSAE